ncbi:MAG: protease modulator HflC [bacterium]
MRRRGILSILVATILVAVLLIFLVSFQVRINECALVFTFGKVARVIQEPGLYWKLPYPIQTVTTYDTRLNLLETKFAEYPTRDKLNVIVALAVGWAVDEPRTFYDRVGTRREAESRLEGLARDAANRVISNHKLAHFISTEEGEFKFARIQESIFSQVRQEAEQQYGVAIPYVRITKLNLPEDVTEDVLKRIEAERQSKADAFIAQGESKATQIAARADREVAEIKNKAENEAYRIRGEADATAAKEYERLQEHPQLARFLRELQAIEQLRKRATYILTTANPPYRLLSPDFKLPGAQLQHQGPAEDEAGQAEGESDQEAR